jgi:hypothetical protein
MKFKDIVPASSKTPSVWLKDVRDFLITQCGWELVEKKKYAIITSTIGYNGYSYNDERMKNSFIWAMFEHPSIPDTILVLDAVECYRLRFFNRDKLMKHNTIYFSSHDDKATINFTYKELQDLEVDTVNGLLIHDSIIALRIAA